MYNLNKDNPISEGGRYLPLIISVLVPTNNLSKFYSDAYLYQCNVVCQTCHGKKNMNIDCLKMNFISEVKC